MSSATGKKTLSEFARMTGFVQPSRIGWKHTKSIERRHARGIQRNTRLARLWEMQYVTDVWSRGRCVLFMSAATNQRRITLTTHGLLTLCGFVLVTIEKRIE